MNATQEPRPLAPEEYEAQCMELARQRDDAQARLVGATGQLALLRSAYNTQAKTVVTLQNTVQDLIAENEALKKPKRKAPTGKGRRAAKPKAAPAAKAPANTEG